MGRRALPRPSEEVRQEIVRLCREATNMRLLAAELGLSMSALSRARRGVGFVPESVVVKLNGGQRVFEKNAGER